MKFLHLFILALITSGTAFSQCGLNQEQYTLDLTTGSDGTEISWSVEKDNKISSFGINHLDNHSYSFDFCLDYGTHNLDLVDLQNDGWNGATYSLKKSDGTVVLTGSGPTAPYNTSSFLVGSAVACQDYDMNLSYSIPGVGVVNTINPGDTVEFCWDINLMATGSYPNSGTTYTQSDATTGFVWNIAGIDGNPFAGQNINDITVDNTIPHLVTLTTTDANNCQMQFKFYIVNPTPNTIITLSVSEDTICVGETSTVFADYENNGVPPFEIEEPIPVFLDDVPSGGSAEYSSTITLGGYAPTATIQDSLCIEKICLTLEHTWMGDLTIHFVVPNGDTITLLEDQNGSGNGNGLFGVDFGEPNADTVPGIGYEYCWTPTATSTMHDLYDELINPFPATIDNGDGTFTDDYASYYPNSFSNAVGSPVNGDWEIIVIDTWTGDDGYIFGWNFDLCLNQEASVSYVDSFWVSPNYPNSFVDPTVDSSQTEIIGMEGDQTQYYQYHLIDNNGCEWFEEIGVYIWDSPVTQSDFTVSCDSMFELGVLDPNLENPGFWEYVEDTINPLDVDFIPNNQSQTPTIQVYETGVYEFEYHSFCGSVITQTVTVDQSIWEVPIVEEDFTESCVNTFSIAVADSNFAEEPGHWEYVAPPGGPTNVIFSPNNQVLSPQITVPELGTYEFIYYNSCGRSDIQTVIIEQESPILDIPEIVTCDFEFDISVTNDIQSGTWTASSADGNNVELGDDSELTTTATVDGYGTYTFTFTFDFCEGHFSQEVEVKQEDPVVSVEESLITCSRKVEGLTATVAGQEGYWDATGPGLVVFSDEEATTTDAAVSEYGIYSFYYYGCDGVDSIDVEFEKKRPTISVSQFVECGLSTAITIDYVGDPGTWDVTDSEGNTAPLEMISDNVFTLSTDEYDQFDIIYTVCDTSISRTVTFYCDLIIPNVFSPNGDALNQEFRIDRLDARFYDQSEFNVFNRWGKKVYHDGQYGLNGNWWDGKDSSHGDDLQAGLYFYTLNLHNSSNGKDEKHSGTIHLFR